TMRRSPSLNSESLATNFSAICVTPWVSSDAPWGSSDAPDCLQTIVCSGFLACAKPLPAEQTATSLYHKLIVRATGVRLCPGMLPLPIPARGVGSTSHHPVFDLADLFDPELDHVTRFEELAASSADAGRRAGEDDIAGIERHAGGELLDLLGKRVDHFAGVGILLKDAIDPQFQAELLRIAEVACRHDPRAERAGAIEGLVLGPVPLERRGIGHIGALPTVARRKIVGDGVAGNISERLVARHVARRAADHGGELHFPV